MSLHPALARLVLPTLLTTAFAGPVSGAEEALGPPGIGAPPKVSDQEARDAWVVPDLMGGIYATHCAVCHGAQFEGAAQGPSLLTETLVHGDSVAALTRSIAQGFPDKGMLGWSAALSAEKNPRTGDPPVGEARSRHGRSGPRCRRAPVDSRRADQERTAHVLAEPAGRRFHRALLDRAAARRPHPGHREDARPEHSLGRRLELDAGDRNAALLHRQRAARHHLRGQRLGARGGCAPRLRAERLDLSVLRRPLSGLQRNQPTDRQARHDAEAGPRPPRRPRLDRSGDHLGGARGDLPGRPGERRRRAHRVRRLGPRLSESRRVPGLPPRAEPGHARRQDPPACTTTAACPPTIPGWANRAR